MAVHAHTDSDTPVDSDTCLVGQLEAWPLIDVLLWLCHSRRTAMVRVGHGLDAGVVFFNQGQLFRCEWGQLTGEEAVVALLSSANGSFSVIQRAIPHAAANIRLPTNQLLLRCAVTLDESERTRRAG